MIISFFIAIVTSLVVLFTTNSLSSFAFSLFIVAIGSICANMINKQYRQYAFKIFYIVFSVYTLLALSNYYGWCYNWSDFINYGNDQYFFLNITENYSNTPISQIIQDCFVYRVHLENEGYVFYIASLARLATYLGDGNHLMLQFLGSVLFGSLSSIILYRLLSFYVTNKASFHYGLLFMMFSVFNYYSIVLLRDIVIAFFFLCAFLIIAKGFSFTRLITLVIIDIVMLQLRFENGVFFLLFPVFIVYDKLKKYKIVFIAIITIVILIAFSFLIQSMTTILQTGEMYKEFTRDSALAVDNSLGKYIWQLPSPIKEICIIINSQIQPFPSWFELTTATNFFNAIIGLLPILYGFFWYTIIFAIIKWILFQKQYKYVEHKLNLVSLLCLLLLIGNISNMNIRRIMCVYPCFYLFYVIVRERQLVSRRISPYIKQTTLIYVCLIAIYLTLKVIV